jgi:uncharacterized membrane protein
MVQGRSTDERLASLPDVVFAVAINITVLQVKPPERPTLAAAHGIGRKTADRMGQR